MIIDFRVVVSRSIYTTMKLNQHKWIYVDSKKSIMNQIRLKKVRRKMVYTRKSI